MEQKIGIFDIFEIIEIKIKYSRLITRYKRIKRILALNIYIYIHLRVLEVHINDIMGITIHFSVSKIHSSYSEKHDSTLFFYYFYMSPLPTLANTIAKSSTLSTSSPVDVKKLQKNSLDISSTGSFLFTMPMDKHILIPYHVYRDGDSTSI